MTLKERIQELNRIEDPVKLRRLCESMRFGRFQFQGMPVEFNYSDMRDCFIDSDPAIDEERFEELMAIADTARFSPCLIRQN